VLRVPCRGITLGVGLVFGWWLISLTGVEDPGVNGVGGPSSIVGVIWVEGVGGFLVGVTGSSFSTLAFRLPFLGEGVLIGIPAVNPVFSSKPSMFWVYTLSNLSLWSSVARYWWNGVGVACADLTAK
jgi:hypothetical protein